MKNIIFLVLACSIFVSTGCSSSKYNLPSLAGLNIKDLEAVKDKGSAKTFNLSKDTAFSETINVLENEGLTVFQSSEKKGYIVAMGFKEQVDTTRVGIFFESVSDKKTKVTLSCLSSLALPKAEKIIFGGLSKYTD
jgi:hypothetical protein